MRFRVWVTFRIPSRSSQPDRGTAPCIQCGPDVRVIRSRVRGAVARAGKAPEPVPRFTASVKNRPPNRRLIVMASLRNRPPPINMGA
jgi:hypothetical protein